MKSKFISVRRCFQFSIPYTATFILCICSLAAKGATDEGPLACVADLQVPRYFGNIQGLPARVEVSVGVGTNGIADSVTTASDVDWIKAEMGSAFKSRTRYVDSCRGKVLKFVVSYLLEGTPQHYPVNVTTFRLPNEFIVRCSPVISPSR